MLLREEKRDEEWSEFVFSVIICYLKKKIAGDKLVQLFKGV